MKADVSRWTFDPLKGYARVLQQQGRPHLDADWNEQVAILLHRLHVLSRDLIGPYGGPSDACGFEISGFAGGPHDFEIGAGRYYVNGVCCENPEKILFSNQPIKVHHNGIETGKYYLVFLDAWEDVVSFADDLNLIEPALGGIDTSMRTRIAWQVRTQEIDPAQDDKYVFDNWHNLVAKWQPPRRGELRARIAPASEERVSEQTFAASTQRYRGLENQLYRVEIHHGGAGTGAPDGATFKWSRENGSVMFRLLKINGNVLTLDRLDASGAAVLTPGDWLEEVVSGGSHPTTPRGPLIRVLHRGPGRDDVTVHWGNAKTRPDPAQPNGVWLRRWDQRARQGNRGGTRLREDDGTVIITEGEGLAGWIALEHGIEVQFSPGATYRPGDYWIIPARIADDGTLLWPVNSAGPRSMGPHGADHAYAPLAIVEFKPIAERKQSCRRQFRPLATIAR